MFLLFDRVRHTWHSRRARKGGYKQQNWHYEGTRKQQKRASGDAVVNTILCLLPQTIFQTQRWLNDFRALLDRGGWNSFLSICAQMSRSWMSVIVSCARTEYTQINPSLTYITATPSWCILVCPAGLYPTTLHSHCTEKLDVLDVASSRLTDDCCSKWSLRKGAGCPQRPLVWGRSPLPPDPPQCHRSYWCQCHCSVQALLGLPLHTRQKRGRLREMKVTGSKRWQMRNLYVLKA